MHKVLKVHHDTGICGNHVGVVSGEDGIDFGDGIVYGKGVFLLVV